ncbi:hypothetical protein TNIN_100911 [Trichonephila inaurata madagascariensis]|uniref:Uncharacterized protein n=1 Tax=Trichonephila inaurata madagascariensis TaxID=2747483 RepID=A0A8X6X8I1_9ARAC|nr:hypothetical protein TNIN_100911 [Trichonephila inaurata madagascariensis]
MVNNTERNPATAATLSGEATDSPMPEESADRSTTSLTTVASEQRSGPTNPNPQPEPSAVHLISDAPTHTEDMPERGLGYGGFGIAGYGGFGKYAGYGGLGNAGYGGLGYAGYGGYGLGYGGNGLGILGGLGYARYGY